MTVDFRDPKQRTAWLIVALLLLGGLARLPGLDREPIWTDEMHTIRSSGIEYASGLPEWSAAHLRQVTQGPLFMLLVHGWSRLVGAGEAALRLLPALLGLLAVPAMYLLATGRLGRIGGALAALLLALSPFHVWYSRELRGYTLVILAAIVATWCFDLACSALARRSWRRAALATGAYVLSALVGIGASFTMAFLLVAHAFILLPRLARSGWRLWAILFALIVVVTAIAWPWIEVMGTRFDLGRLVGRPGYEEAPLRGASTFPPSAIPYTFYAFSAGFSLGPSLDALHDGSAGVLLRRHAPIIALVGILFGGLAGAGVAALIRRDRRQAIELLLMIAVPFLLAALLAAANVKPWNARYVAVALPAFLLLVTAGIQALGVFGRRGGWLAAILLVLAVQTVAVVQLHTCERYWKEDYRTAGRFLEERIGTADALIGVGAPGPLFFYLDPDPAVFTHLNPRRIGDERQLSDRLRVAAAGASRVWVVRCRVWLHDPDNRIGALLGEERRLVEVQALRGIRIECYE